MGHPENTVGMNGGVRYILGIAECRMGGDKMVSGKRDGTASHDMMQYDMIPYRLG